MEDTKINKPLLIFVLMCMGFLIMAVGATTPALASIGQAFPNIPFSLIVLIATLPSLILVPFSLVSGKLAGTVMTFKSLSLLGIVLVLIGGAGPYLISNFTLILILRGILGAGLGILSPIGGALILNLFEPKTAENLMGASVVVGNIGGIVFQLLGGILCAINWKLTFLAYLLAAIPLIVVILFFPRLPLAPKTEAAKVKMTSTVYIWSTIYGLLMLLVYPMLTGMSSLVLGYHYGNAAGAGVALTMFTVGGMVAGAIFGITFRIFTRFTIPIGVILTAAGFLFFVFGTSLTFFIVGATIVGIGFSLAGTTIMMNVGRSVPPEGTAFAMSIVMALMQLGGFISGFVFAFVEKITGATSLRFPFEFSLVCFVIYTVLHLIFVSSKKPETSKPQSPSV